ncbi:HlyD family secretion protein [Fulvimarina sp. 2208YS6-2-32]|uniref:HlyD family secretion protein n=1 Tax=Fulvimarina uroteuthidis TaxID=3098149 RepID=A0ABU5HYG4_9HYPH|nr:HlyD family secretion protein [Fulvimarina sp. 2208YS6-2-32]MDY8107996.1 HlyD family secretion protein [Fulvimarina sp. 2208YS6-2-32]
MIILRLLLTAAIVVGAVFGITYVWTTYFEDPWTRDAYVRADVIEIASYVPGVLTQLNVVNNQRVKKGDLLVQVDRKGYETAVERARAQVAKADAEYELQRQQAARLTELETRDQAAVANVNVANARLRTSAAQAALEAARQQLRAAELDVARTTIRAPADGYVANLTADTGDFVSAGNPFLAVIDETSFRVDAYFMETKLPQIREGANARIRLMASDHVLKGRVQGIARGIYRAEANSSALLEAPEPSFQWIRLAQRIPVQIDILERPNDVPLIAGQTVSVIIGTETDEDRGVTGWIGERVAALLAALH